MFMFHFRPGPVVRLWGIDALAIPHGPNTYDNLIVPSLTWRGRCTFSSISLIRRNSSGVGDNLWTKMCLQLKTH